MRLTNELRLTPDGKNYIVPVPDEWIVLNPIWKALAPEVVEQAKLRIAEREKRTTPTNES